VQGDGVHDPVGAYLIGEAVGSINISDLATISPTQDKIDPTFGKTFGEQRRRTRFLISTRDAGDATRQCRVGDGTPTRHGRERLRRESNGLRIARWRRLRE